MDSVSAVKWRLGAYLPVRVVWPTGLPGRGSGAGQSDARSAPAGRTGLDGHVNYMLVMRNERDGLVAIGPVSIEYQAAMIGDELEESAGWTTVGIARVLTAKQARTIAAATGG